MSRRVSLGAIMDRSLPHKRTRMGGNRMPAGRLRAHPAAYRPVIRAKSSESPSPKTGLSKKNRGGARMKRSEHSRDFREKRAGVSRRAPSPSAAETKPVSRVCAGTTGGPLLDLAGRIGCRPRPTATRPCSGRARRFVLGLVVRRRPNLRDRAPSSCSFIFRHRGTSCPVADHRPFYLPGPPGQRTRMEALKPLGGAEAAGGTGSSWGRPGGWTTGAPKGSPRSEWPGGARVFPAARPGHRTACRGCVNDELSF